MRSHGMVDIERDLAGLRQEVRILGIERNKLTIELQRLQHEITKGADKNGHLATRLDQQNDTINLLKKQIVMS